MKIGPDLAEKNLSPGSGCVGLGLCCVGLGWVLSKFKDRFISRSIRIRTYGLEGGWGKGLKKVKKSMNITFLKTLK